MGGVLQYKWEAYCDTNGRSADSSSLSSERRGTVSTAMPIGGVLQYKLEAYCNTNWRCIAIIFWEVVVVSVSDILLIHSLEPYTKPCSDTWLWLFHALVYLIHGPEDLFSATFLGHRCWRDCKEDAFSLQQRSRPCVAPLVWILSWCARSGGGVPILVAINAATQVNDSQSQSLSLRTKMADMMHMTRKKHAKWGWGSRIPGTSLVFWTPLLRSEGCTKVWQRTRQDIWEFPRPWINTAL